MLVIEMLRISTIWTPSKLLQIPLDGRKILNSLCKGGASLIDLVHVFGQTQKPRWIGEQSFPLSNLVWITPRVILKTVSQTFITDSCVDVGGFDLIFLVITLLMVDHERLLTVDMYC